ncbi:hypothetical protein HK102_006952, partial [Quaeritorhiza haematococci]
NAYESEETQEEQYDYEAGDQQEQDQDQEYEGGGGDEYAYEAAADEGDGGDGGGYYQAGETEGVDEYQQEYANEEAGGAQEEDAESPGGYAQSRDLLQPGRTEAEKQKSETVIHVHDTGAGPGAGGRRPSSRGSGGGRRFWKKIGRGCKIGRRSASRKVMKVSCMCRLWMIVSLIVLAVALAIVGVCLFYFYFLINLEVDTILLSPSTTTPTTGVTKHRRELENYAFSSFGTDAVAKVYIRSIDICHDLKLTDMGYANPHRCITVHKNPDQSPDPSTYDFAALKSDTSTNTARWTNLLDPTSLAKLKGNITLNGNGGGYYKYGVVSWYRPAVVKAAIDINATHAIVTRGGEGWYQDLTGGNYLLSNKSLVVPRETAGTAMEEAVVPLPSSGTWFRFQKPWDISPTDIFYRNPWKLTLVVDPEALIIAAKSGLMGGLRDPTGATFHMHAPQLYAIAHRSNQSIVHERYELTLPNASNTTGNVTMRLALFYVLGAETDIQAASLFVIPGPYTSNSSSTSTTATTLSNQHQIPGSIIVSSPRIGSVSVDSDGRTYRIKDNQEKDLLRMVDRSRRIGDQGAVKVFCSGFPGIDQCAGGKQVLDAAWVLSHYVVIKKD